MVTSREATAGPTLDPEPATDPDLSGIIDFTTTTRHYSMLYNSGNLTSLSH